MNQDRENGPSINFQKLQDNLASGGPIPAASILRTMEGVPWEIHSLMFAIVMEPKSSERIVPPLTLEERQKIVLHYLSRCIIEDPPDEVAHSRWTACYEFANWVRWLWTNSSAPRLATTTAKELIRKLYMEGDSSRRKAIVQGMLEHLFENQSVRDFFKEWAGADPELRAAFEEASEWSNRGGRSPLWRSES